MPSVCKQCELLRMLADHHHVIRQPREHLRTQIPETAVAKDDDAVGARIGDLRRDLKCGRHRLGEDGDVIGQRVGHRVQIALRHGDQVGKRTVVIEDAEHGAVRDNACAAPLRQVSHVQHAQLISPTTRRPAKGPDSATPTNS